MPTFFHREVPSSPHLPSHSIPPGCSGDESSGRPSFWLTTHPPEGSNLGCFADRLRKQVVACLPEESKWAGYLQRAWQRALPSEAVWVMALPSQSSLPRGFATERTTEKLFAGARRLFQKSLISWAPKYVTLRWETRGCFFFSFGLFFSFFFFSRKFAIYPLQSPFTIRLPQEPEQSNYKQEETAQQPHELFPIHLQSPNPDALRQQDLP